MSANYVTIQGGTTYTLTLTAENLVQQKNQFRLICKTSGGAITIILPAISAFGTGVDAKIFIDDSDDMAAINNITVQVAVGVTIANANDFVIDENGEKIEVFISSKTEYGVLGSGGNSAVATKTTLMGLEDTEFGFSPQQGIYPLHNTLTDDITAVGIRKSYAVLYLPVGQISTLETISFPDLSEANGGMYLDGQDTALLESVSFPKIQAPDNINLALEFFNLPSLVDIDIPIFSYLGVFTTQYDLYVQMGNCPLISSFDMPNITDIISSNSNATFSFILGDMILVETINFSSLENTDAHPFVIFYFYNLPICSTIDFTSLINYSYLGYIQLENIGLLTTFEIPTLLTAGGIIVSSCPVLTSIAFDSATIGSGVNISFNPELTSISFPLLDLAGSDAGISITSNPELPSISFPSLTQALTLNIDDNELLSSLSVPLLENVVGDVVIISNDILPNVDLSELLTTNFMDVRDNPLLTSLVINSAIIVASSTFNLINNAFIEATVDDILSTLDTGGQINGILKLEGGTNATPSAAGLVSKANLEGKGWTVTNN